eukprot:3088227-Rhodomonas_salina.1
MSAEAASDVSGSLSLSLSLDVEVPVGVCGGDGPSQESRLWAAQSLRHASLSLRGVVRAPRAQPPRLTQLPQAERGLLKLRVGASE